MNSLFTTTLLLFATLLFFSSPPTASATTYEDWEKIILEGSTLKFDGQYKLAGESYAKALTLSQTSGMPAKCLPITLCRLADVYVITNRIDDAEKIFPKIIDIIRTQKSNGSLDPQVSFWAAMLSDSYLTNLQPQTKEKCLKRACYLKDLIYGSAHHECLQCLNNLALFYVQNGNIDKAMRILTLSQPALDKKYGPDPNRLGNVLNQLAIKSRSKYENAQAKELELLALKQINRKTDQLIAAKPSIFFLLSMTSLAQNEKAEAQKYFEESLKSCYGLTSVRKKLAETYLDSLVPLIKQDRTSKIRYLASTEFEELIKVYEKIPTDIGSRFLIYTYLAELGSADFKNPEKTPNYLLKAIEIAEYQKQTLGKYLAGFYTREAIGYGSSGKLIEMEKSFKKALNSSQDKTRFEEAYALFWWGYYLQKNKRFPEALDKFHKCCSTAIAIPNTKRGTLLADSEELISNITLYQLHDNAAAEILHEKSKQELNEQLRLKTNIGPDIFHRL